MASMKPTALTALILSVLFIAPGAPVLLGGNSPLGKNILDAGCLKVGGELSSELQQGFGDAWFGEAVECFIAPSNGVRWNNGWRTADGKFASPQGLGRSGAAAESAVWDAVEAKPGWQVIRGRVSVRDASGQLRVYDGAAVSPKGRVIGLEVKSGSARLTPAQRSFDSTLNASGTNTVQGVGQSRGISVRRAAEIRQK